VVQLSKRERKVLNLHSLGSSKKNIARELGISLRTV
jgi:DNA-binding NarL/FixJ family response regulator